MQKDVEPYRLLGGLRRESFYPIVQGYKDTAAIGMPRRTSRIRCSFNRLAFVGVVQPGLGPARRRARAPRGASTSGTTGAATPR